MVSYFEERTKLQLYENKILRKIFLPNKDEGNWQVKSNIFEKKHVHKKQRRLREDGLMMYLREQGCKDGRCVELAQDRVQYQWRLFLGFC